MLRQVVDDVLDLSKLEVGTPTIKRCNVDVVDVTSGIAKMHHLLAEEKGIHLNCDVDWWIRNAYWMWTNGFQILTNLLGNAIKHTEKGHVQLDIWEDPNRPDWIFAEVTDEGPGIPKEHRERIFEPFGMVQYDSYHEEHRMDSGSTGLGLSIARELARVLGGICC